MSQRLVAAQGRQRAGAGSGNLQGRQPRTLGNIEFGERSAQALLDAIKAGASEGMQDFDGEIERLVRDGTVDLESALAYATEPANCAISLPPRPRLALISSVGFTSAVRVGKSLPRRYHLQPWLPAHRRRELCPELRGCPPPGGGARVAPSPSRQRASRPARQCWPCPGRVHRCRPPFSAFSPRRPRRLCPSRGGRRYRPGHPRRHRRDQGWRRA